MIEIQVDVTPSLAVIKATTDQTVKIYVLSPIVKNVPIIAIAKNVYMVTGDPDVQAAAIYIVHLATTSMANVINAKMGIGAIDVNMSVQSTVQRHIVTCEVACVLPARMVIGVTIAMIPVHLINAQVLVNVPKRMDPCVTNVFLGDGAIFVNMNVPPTALMAARNPLVNVM